MAGGTEVCAELWRLLEFINDWCVRQLEAGNMTYPVSGNIRKKLEEEGRGSNADSPQSPVTVMSVCSVSRVGNWNWPNTSEQDDDGWRVGEITDGAEGAK